MKEPYEINLAQLNNGIKLTGLDLSKYQWGYPDWQKELSKVLETNTFLTHLNLMKIGLHGYNAEVLSEALKINSSLKNLNFERNSLEDGGTECLSEALKINTSLRTLNLKDNKIKTKGAKALSKALKINASLISLNLHTNKIGDKGITALSEVLKNNASLRDLDLGCNEISAIGVKYLSEVLKINTALNNLNLQSNRGIGDAGVKELSEALQINTCLRSLNLSETNFSSDGAKSLSEALIVNTNLISLDLSNTRIDSGLQYLSAALKINKSLRDLDLVHAIIAGNVKDLSEALEMNSGLRSLNLQANSIDNAGAVYLCKALKINTSLSDLNLNNNCMSLGAKYLSEVLETNISLRKLSFKDNKTGDAGAIDISKALKINTTLTSLEFSGNDIGDAGAIALSEALEINPSITTLSLSNNQITDTGAKALSEALKTNTSITSLNLGGNQIGDAGAKALSEALKTNTSSLNLGGNKIGDAGAKALSEALKINNITSLNLRTNTIGDAGVKALSEALKTNTSLTHLDLEHNYDVSNNDIRRFLDCNLENTAIQYFAEALETNYNLIELKGCRVTAPKSKIYPYLYRNKLLAECLKPLTEAISTGSLFNDDKLIKTILFNLGKLLPELDSLPEDSYPMEAYRLLNGLGHMSQLGEEAQIEALKCLLPSFKHPVFKLYANKNLGRMLMADSSNVLKKYNPKKECFLISLYSFKNHLHEPDVKHFAQMALFKLTQDEEYTMDEKKLFEENTRVLTQNALLKLVKRALDNCEKENPNSCETRLLKALFDCKTCYSVSLSTACLSKAFINVFKTEYPQVKSFTTREHCLLTYANDSASFLVDIIEPSREVRENDIAEYNLKLEQDPESIFENLKDSINLQLSSSDQFSKSIEPNADSTNEKTIQTNPSQFGFFTNVSVKSSSAASNSQLDNSFS